jgi:branched-chain amino acid transport system substrate-binding protein
MPWRGCRGSNRSTFPLPADTTDTSVRRLFQTNQQTNQIRGNQMRGIRFKPTMLAVALASAVSFAGDALAQKKYDAGATDTEIKIGNIMPYSGPASAYSAIGRTEAAYFKKINDEGGINGRKIEFLSYDDGYSPPKAVEQARKLVESDEVLLIFSPMGTPSNSAIQKYMNARKVPQLFVASYAERWNDPKNFPWTMGLGTTYQNEGGIYATYILKERPDARIAVLYQNDDAGKELLKGLKNQLGSRAEMIVAESSYEVTEPTIDSHVVQLKASGADVLLSFATPKFAAQSIKKVAELGWNPLHFLLSVSSSVGATLKPAGFANAQNIISATYLKDTLDTQWDGDPGMKRYLEFLGKYMPEANRADSVLALGYLSAQALVQVLKQCGDDLTRANIMKQAASLKGASSDLLIPGIDMNTDPQDFAPLTDMRLMRFNGEKWELFGDIIRGAARN